MLFYFIELYSDVFGRNPDQEGLDYWTGAGGEGMSLADIEASFRGSAEAKLRDNIGGTSNYQSIDDYQAGKNPVGQLSGDADVIRATPPGDNPMQATSDRVDQYIAATGQTGDVAAKTRADTMVRYILNRRARRR